MSYLALARKWRPRTFSQLVGQEHVNQALINALNQQRIHHAFLFTGTRGVGKTSIARLMAKSLNCEQGISADPCLQCQACLAIEQGRFIDLIEVDAASKTRVEDTRDLLDNVQYAPTSGRYKIYLIDEVHMLSQHSFNALLKTLEEPPEHVKFLLATTDPQKLPVTILSRCLQFNLRSLPEDVIVTQLQHIMNEEKQACEPEAIQLLAKAAQGSMRDALSLLDQVIACAGDLLSTQQVKSILGYTQQDYALQIVQALIQQKASELITLSRAIASEGGHFIYVLNEIIDYFHQITLYQNVPGGHPLLTYLPEIQKLSQDLAMEDTQLFYQIALKGLEDIHLAPSLIIGFEMTVLRMLAFKPAAKAKLPALAVDMNPITTAPKPVSIPTPAPVKSSDVAVSVQAQASLVTIQNKVAAPEPKLVADKIEYTEALTNNPPVDSSSWGAVLPQLNLSGLALNAAENAEFVAKEKNHIQFKVDKGHQSLFTKAVTQRIEQALTNFYNEAIKIELTSDDSSVQATPARKKQQEQAIRQENAVDTLQKDPFLQQLQQEFSAEVVKNSIVAVEDPL